jgi:transcriptional regulator with XRE-family HTH domain
MRVVKPTVFPDNPELTSPKQLGAAIRAGRTGSNITLEQAALALGMAKQTLSDIENGKATVALGNVLAAAHGLGVSLFVVPSDQREAINLKFKNM